MNLDIAASGIERLEVRTEVYLIRCADQERTEAGAGLRVKHASILAAILPSPRSAFCAELQDRLGRVR